MEKRTKGNTTLQCEMQAINFLNQASEHSMQNFELEIDSVNGDDFYNISVNGDRLLEGSVLGINLIQVAAFILRNYVVRHTNITSF